MTSSPKESLTHSKIKIIKYAHICIAFMISLYPIVLPPFHTKQKGCKQDAKKSISATVQLLSTASHGRAVMEAK